MSRKTFYLDLIERSAWTFMQAFAAQMLVAGLDIVGAVSDMSIADKAKVAAGAGLIAVFKALVVNKLPWTGQNSASSLPEEVDPPNNPELPGGVDVPANHDGPGDLDPPAGGGGAPFHP